MIDTLLARAFALADYREQAAIHHPLTPVTTHNGSNMSSRQDPEDRFLRNMCWTIGIYVVIQVYLFRVMIVGRWL